MPSLSLTFKGQHIKTFSIVEGTMLIGSQADCQIFIDSLALLPQHARIETSDHQSILYNLASKEGSYVNQQRIEQHTLKDGDLIQVGKHTLGFSQAAEELQSGAVPEEHHDPSSMLELHQPISSAVSTTPSAEQHGWLQILNGENLGKTLSLRRNRTKLGKRGVATALITRSDDGYYISHYEGKYPPLIDDTPIREQRYHLTTGEIIQIGNIRLQFYLN